MMDNLNLNSGLGGLGSQESQISPRNINQYVAIAEGLRSNAGGEELYRSTNVFE